MTNTQVGRLVAAALADVESTLTVVAAAAELHGADRYRDALDELCRRLGTCRDAVHAAARAAPALEVASPFAASVLP